MLVQERRNNFPHFPNSNASSVCWTRRLRASPPPKPTPKRTGKTPARCLKAICNRCSRNAARGGKIRLEELLERGWIEGHLDGNHGGDYPRKEEFINTGIPYISANCLTDERVDMSRAKYLSPERAALLRKGIAKNNDVLFAHNATVGPVAILQTNEEKVILGTSLTYYRCNSNYILPAYLAHYMRSFGFKTQYLTVMRQSTRNQVPITKQREFFHVFPSLPNKSVKCRRLTPSPKKPNASKPSTDKSWTRWRH